MPDPATLLASVTRLEVWLDALSQTTEVGLDRTVVGGFSQGGAMSYVAALSPGWPRLAGIICCGTFIPELAQLELDDTRAEGLPVLIAHGTYDPVIPIRRAREARARMAAAGGLVTCLESPVVHMIDARHVGPMRSWLDAIVADDPAAPPAR